MHRKVLFVIWLMLVVVFVSACDTGTASSEFKDPTVKLSRVEVQSYFAPPWAGWPAAPPTPTPAPNITTTVQYTPFPGAIPVPMVLAFIWDINNPNDQPVTLDNMKFTVEFEAAPQKPNEYFPLNTVIVQEKQSIPPKATNQLRATAVLDSSIVPGNLAVTSGQRLASLGITNTAALIQNWWTNIGDFKFGVRATQGTADFKSQSGQTKVVTFEGKFPNK